nr:alpha-mannosidase [Desnuesiella massiliensis]
MMLFELERVERILMDIEKSIYPGSVKIKGFKVKDGKFDGGQEPELDDSKWENYNLGDFWGEEDKHRWFRTEVEIPKEFHGKFVVFNITTGLEGEWDATNPQFLMYINGELVQGLDINHRRVTISKEATAGRKYKIALLAYTGLIKEKTKLIGELKVLDSNIEEFYYNLKVPYSAARILQDEDDNKMNILKILKQAINLLDLRKIYSKEFYASIDEANNCLKENFYKDINYKSPLVTAVGHTHIDVAWLWTVSQTREKAVRSFSTVLKLMEEYPEYTFMSSQPQLYEFVKEDEPELYEKIKEKVKEGRWEVDGAMWLEPDCNIPSGESLVRQMLFGMRFFEKEFGVKCKTLWLPDVFGYSAALPQIMKKCGVDYFMTTKLGWNQFNRMPNDTFMWEGIDGSEIFTHFVTTCDYSKFDADKATFSGINSKTTYTGNINANQTMGTWKRYQNKDLNEETLMLYGFGDGGGGPTEEMLENAKRLKYGIPGLPRLELGKEIEFFNRAYLKMKDCKKLPKWVGELYFEYHRGTYTSMAKNKRFNRKSEVLYGDIETLASFNRFLGKEYPTEQLNNAWKTILLNQFHDIIPGTCIEPVYDQTDKEYTEILENGNELLKENLKNLSSQIGLEKRSIVIFNTLSFDRSDIVEVNIPKGLEIKALRDIEGNEIKVQYSENGESIIAFVEKIPSKGYKVYDIVEGKCSEESILNIANKAIENQFYNIKFDEDYNIASIYDKKNKREVLKEKGNVLQAFEDRPMNWENWDIDIYYKEKMYEINDLQKVEVIEEGPVRCALKLTRNFYDSSIEQIIYVYHHVPRIDFKTKLNWKEHNILLKAAFPVDINSSKATYEIQYGNVERETHDNTSWDLARFEVCGHKWADLSEAGYGVSLLNDCKYGYDIKNGVMRLTLLKCGTYPNPNADIGEHEFIYSLYPHENTWREANTQQQAYNLNVPMHSIIEEAHKGVLPKSLSMFTLDKHHCMVEVVKKEEDGEGVILRIYEYMNKRSKVKLTSFKAMEQVFECDLLENKLNDISKDSYEFEFDIKPYEIKTFLLNFKN